MVRNVTAQFRAWSRRFIPKSRNFDLRLCKELLWVPAQPSTIRLRFGCSTLAAPLRATIPTSPSDFSTAHGPCRTRIDRQMKRENPLTIASRINMRRKDSFLSAYMPGFSFSISFSSAGSGCIPSPSVAYLHIFSLCSVFRRNSSRHRTTIRYVTPYSAINSRMIASRRGVIAPNRDLLACGQNSRSQFSVCPKV